jgi:hypothetical protein
VTCALLLAAWLVAGCANGSEAREKARPTATPPAAEATPAGIDVAEVNSARDDFVAACKARKENGGALTDARRAAATLLAALKANPDQPFRRSPGAPAATMRDRVRAAALVARTQCGDGAAVKLGDRLAAAAGHDSS